jgi:uncharacterized protein
MLGERPRAAVLAAAIAITIGACGASHPAVSTTRQTPDAPNAPARAPQPQPQPQPQPLPTVLVLTQTLGYHHMSIPTASAAIRRLATRSGRYRVKFLPTAADLTPRTLRHATAVMFLLTTGELPMTPTDKRALVAFVRRGGGLIGFHSATDTFHHWTAYKQMIGAEFSHHPQASTERVIVEDRDTPATRGLPKSFEIHEEFYVFKHDPRPHVHVLVRLDTGPGGPDRPLVWCRRFGSGRVYYDELGHFSATWHNPLQLTLAAGGIDWAVGLVPAPACSNEGGY